MPNSRVPSTETPPKLPKLGGSMIRNRTSSTERPPRTVTATFIETGGSYSESLRRRKTLIRATTIVTTRTIGMKSSASQALPPAPGTEPEKPSEPETSTPNQVKNMKMKRRTAETPAIFSPVLSLSTSICIPSVEAWSAVRPCISTTGPIRWGNGRPF